MPPSGLTSGSLHQTLFQASQTSKDRHFFVQQLRLWLYPWGRLWESQRLRDLPGQKFQYSQW
jgi:hypothetical protein